MHVLDYNSEDILIVLKEAKELVKIFVA